MHVTRHAGHAPRTIQLQAETMGLPGCIGCPGCTGMCAALLEMMSLPPAVLGDTRPVAAG